MREIKFRAYIKEVNKNYPCCVSQHRTDDWSNIAFVEWRDYVDWFNCNIMQYTWLKDKNWKEIYEGDIISFKRLKKENVPVVFIDDGFKISVKTWPCSTRTTGLNYLLSEYQCEVIWNIYENQELLK